MSHAIRIHDYGGPEALRWEPVDVAEPGPGEVRLQQTAIGLNYIDTYHRTGLYKLPTLPAILGREAVGIVEAVGAGVDDFSIGDRVTYLLVPGGYAQSRVIAAESLIPIPDGVDDLAAAAVLLKGLTAWYLLRRTYVVQPGDTVLIHAAAGGVGLLACQWARALGATVIGTVGSDEKADLAREHGCDYPIVYTREDFAQRVTEITGDAKLPVVYDSVGRDTWEGSLACLRRRGLLVLFGQASGPVPPIEVGRLASNGSLFLTRPTLVDYIADRGERLEAAAELFAKVAGGSLRVLVGQTYALKDAAQAHRDLEQRATRGSTVLLPQG